jgi:hypothetical protein
MPLRFLHTSFAAPDNLGPNKRKGGAIMYKKLAFIIALVCVFAFTGTALAAPPTYSGTIIAYDGWLHQTITGEVLTSLVADTLIVVTNGHPSLSFNAAIQVYDTAGNYYGSTNFFVGFNPPAQVAAIPGQQYGWITLGQIVNRSTRDPWNFPAGEKFLFEISTNTSIPPTVEIKQVVYADPIPTYPSEKIWDFPGRQQCQRYYLFRLLRAEPKQGGR